MVKLWVMVSVPERSRENVYKSPIILGVFTSKEKAQRAWREKDPSFKDIKAKTVHIYSEYLENADELSSDKIFMAARYTAYSFNDGEPPHLNFTPGYNGFYSSLADYSAKQEWLAKQDPINQRELCSSLGWTFYSSNEKIIHEFEIDKLTRLKVELTDIQEY